MSTMEDAAAYEVLEELTTPLPIAEYHEDMGPMLWWHWKWFDGAKCWGWANEEPYVGSPLDLGRTVEAHTTTRIISQTQQDHDPAPHIERVSIGGWPGYHTHFTPIPKVKAPMPDSLDPGGVLSEDGT